MSIINTLPFDLLKEVTSFLPDEADTIFKETSFLKARFGTIHQSLEIANLIKAHPLKKATLNEISEIFFSRMSLLAPFSNPRDFKVSLKSAMCIPCYSKSLHAALSIFTNALGSLGIDSVMEMALEIPRDEKNSLLLCELSKQLNLYDHLDSALEVAKSMPNLTDREYSYIEDYLYIVREEQGHFHGIHWGWEHVDNKFKNSALERCSDRLIEIEDIDRAIEVTTEISDPLIREDLHIKIVDKLIIMNQYERAIGYATSTLDVNNRNLVCKKIAAKFTDSGDATQVVEFLNLMEEAYETPDTGLKSSSSRDIQLENASKCFFEKEDIKGSLEIGMQINSKDRRNDLFEKLALRLVRAGKIVEALEITKSIEDKEIVEEIMKRIQGSRLAL
jgi:hypothetical protein